MVSSRHERMIPYESKIRKIRNFIIFGVSHRLCPVLWAVIHFPKYKIIHTGSKHSGTHCQCHLQLHDQLSSGFSGKADGKVGNIVLSARTVYPLHEQYRTAYVCTDPGHFPFCRKNSYGADAFSCKLPDPEKNHFPA